jgi:hypothetical protein
MKCSPGVTLFRKRKILNVSVDSPEEQKKNPTQEKFSVAIFAKGEWNLLRTFCTKYEIKQIHLITLFHQYLQHEEVYIRNFRVRLDDPKHKYAPFSPLMRELSDVFMPSIFLKEFPRLPLDLMNIEEITFTRLVIMSYLFGASQVPDLIYDFFSILRKNMKIHVSALVSIYSFQQLCILLMEDLDKLSGTYKYLKRIITSLDTNKDYSLQIILYFGMKYPLLFYSLVRFRKLFQRFLFGDLFWNNRKYMKLRCLEHLPFDIKKGSKIKTKGNLHVKMKEKIAKENEEKKKRNWNFSKRRNNKKVASEIAIEAEKKKEAEEKEEVIDEDDYNNWYENEEVAIKFTARSFIMDALYDHKIYTLTNVFYDHMITKITYEEMLKLIEMIGYKAARKLTIEGDIEYDDFNPLFIVPFKSELQQNDEQESHVFNSSSNLGVTSGESVSQVVAQEEEVPETAMEEDMVQKEEAEKAEADGIQKQKSIKLFEKKVDDDENDSFGNGSQDDEGEEYELAIDPDKVHRYPRNENEYQVILDDTTNHEFLYDVETGRKMWVKTVRNENGEVMRKFL